MPGSAMSTRVNSMSPRNNTVLKATSLILTICSPGKNTTPRIALEQEIARNAAVKSGS
jgi:hypothetical protein